jgi:hypothetical protein
MIAAACIFAIAGIGMLWVGKRLIRGLRFLVTLVPDRVRRAVQKARGRTNAANGPVPQFSNATVNGGE